MQPREDQRHGKQYKRVQDAAGLHKANWLSDPSKAVLPVRAMRTGKAAPEKARIFDVNSFQKGFMASTLARGEKVKYETPKNRKVIDSLLFLSEFSTIRLAGCPTAATLPSPLSCNPFLNR